MCVLKLLVLKLLAEQSGVCPEIILKLLGGGAGPNLFQRQRNCAAALHVSTVADDAGVKNGLRSKSLGCAGPAVQL